MTGKISANLLMGVAAIAFAMALPAAAQTPQAAPSRTAAATDGAVDIADATPAPDEGDGGDDVDITDNADDDAGEVELAKDNTAEDDANDAAPDDNDDPDADDAAGQKPDAGNPGAGNAGPDNAGKNNAGPDNAGPDKASDAKSGERRSENETAPAWQRATLQQSAKVLHVVGPQPTFAEREDHRDGSTSLTFGARLPSAVQARVGFDLHLNDRADAGPIARPLAAARDRTSGSAWSEVAVPAAPIGFDETMLRARVDSSPDENKFTATIRQKLGDDLRLTLRKSYTVSGESSGAPATVAADRHWSGSQSVRLDLLATDTAIAATSKMSAASESALNSLSAEQKIAGPLSITGTIGETGAGVTDKSLRAKLSTTW